MRTFLYIDGFNLYYGALEGTPCNELLASILNGYHLRRFGEQPPGDPPQNSNPGPACSPSEKA